MLTISKLEKRFGLSRATILYCEREGCDSVVWYIIVLGDWFKCRAEALSDHAGTVVVGIMNMSDKLLRMIKREAQVARSSLS